MIFGTEGQRAAGTSEKLTPRITMSVTARPFEGKAGSRKAKLRWHAIMITEPIISIVAPLPLWSRNMPSTGVRHIASMGKQLKSFDARAAQQAAPDRCFPFICYCMFGSSSP